MGTETEEGVQGPNQENAPGALTLEEGAAPASVPGTNLEAARDPVAALEAMKAEAQREIDRLLVVYRNGRAAFLDGYLAMGRAVREIHDRDLFRIHGTWEAFCRRFLQIGRDEAHRMMQEATAYDNLQTSEISHVLPQNPAQLHALAGLEPEQQVEAWSEVAAAVATEGGRITAGKIRKAATAVKERKAPPEPEPKPETADSGSKGGAAATFADVRDEDLTDEEQQERQEQQERRRLIAAIGGREGLEPYRDALEALPIEQLQRAYELSTGGTAGLLAYVQEVTGKAPAEDPAEIRELRGIRDALETWTEKHVLSKTSQEILDEMGKLLVARYGPYLDPKTAELWDVFAKAGDKEELTIATLRQRCPMTDGEERVGLAVLRAVGYITKVRNGVFSRRIESATAKFEVVAK